MNTILCRAVLSAFLLIVALTPAPAQDWPSRNVTVIVPVPAGVASDIVARVVFEQVGRQVGHSTAKANPGKLNYATVGVGSAAHFGTEQLAMSAGFSAQHVPFKGGEWLTAVIAGRLDFAVAPVTSAIGLISDGKLVPLAISSSTRLASLPNVPTMVEAGLKSDAVYPFYTGAYLPAGTPHAIAEKLHDEVMKALALPAVRERLAAVNVDPMPMTLAEVGSFFKKDVAANLELVKAAKIPRQ